MSKAEATVDELVSKIKRGELRLPEMQRRYVWRAPRVRDLLDSLYRKYPSGSILVWETDEEVPLQPWAVEQQSNPYQSTQLLLDGQQRLTSLAAVIRGELVQVRGRKKPIELLFNLEHPDELTFVTEVHENATEDSNGEERIEDETDSTEDELQKRFDRMTFVVATKKLAQLPHWVKVTDVFKSDSDAEFLKRAGVTNFDDPNYKRYSQRLSQLRSIRKYVYRMDVLERNLSYQEVTEIFVRVNSLGAKLRSSDLALAQITAKWHNSLKEFQAFQKECKEDGFDLDLGSMHLRNLIAFATNQSRFHTVGNLTVEALQANWETSKQGMQFAINFMRSNLGIESPALLSSSFILIALAYYGHKKDYSLPPEEVASLQQWVLLANAKGRYSRGSSETILDQDIATLRDGGNVDGLMDRLRLQVGRLDITPEELEGRNQRSSLFKTMFLAFRASDAKDWKDGVIISLSHSGMQHKLQFHHIFPKALLKKEGITRKADDIANLCFISGRMNRKISDKSPETYLPDIIAKAGTAPFDAQCIPLNEELICVDSYNEFLKQRRKLIAKRLDEFLNQSAGRANLPAER